MLNVVIYSAFHSVVANLDVAAYRVQPVQLMMSQPGKKGPHVTNARMTTEDSRHHIELQSSKDHHCTISASIYCCNAVEHCNMHR